MTRDQLRRAGLNDDRIDYRLKVGRLRNLHQGVFALGAGRLEQPAYWLAAVLACGLGAVLSHRTAAALWGIRSSPAATIDVTVPARGGRERREGVRVHRVPRLPAAEVTRLDAIPVTGVARTLIDLAGVVPRAAVARAVHESDRLGLFDLRDVDAALNRNAGRPGAGALAAVIAELREEPLTRSELERRFLELCANAGLPPPAVNAVIAGFEVDFLGRRRG